MSKNIPYSQELKDEVINRIKAGEATSDVAREKAIVPRLVYQWVAKTTEIKSDKNYVLEIGKLNKEVSELYRLIGKLTADMSKKKIELINDSYLTKVDICKKLNISRSLSYYGYKREEVDLEIKAQIESVLTSNPFNVYYGIERISLSLGFGIKRIRRVVNKFKIILPHKALKKRIKRRDQNKDSSNYPNLIANRCPIVPNYIYGSDFTYIRFKNIFIYLAVIFDLFTKEVIGFKISRYHNSNLVLEALEEAVIYYPIPEIMHSDQGSEYLSKIYTNTLKNLNILISNSDKGSPWQNGYVESYFGKFKEELGDINKFNSLGEVIEYIYNKIYYYNNDRIHTTLKMPPVKFKQLFFQKKKALLVQ